MSRPSVSAMQQGIPVILEGRHSVRSETTLRGGKVIFGTDVGSHVTDKTAAL
jgi:hypothetical protein